MNGLLKLDGHDNALIGVITDGFGLMRLAYDSDVIIANLERDGMTNEDAIEWFEFNMHGAWVGENGPAYITRQTMEEVDEMEDSL